MKFVFCFLFLTCFTAYAQDDYFASDNIADCSGAVEILNNGSYTVQFTGNSGFIQDLGLYDELKDVQEKNSLFFKFTAPYDGKLSLDADISSGLVQLFVFQSSSGSIESDLLLGAAQLKRSIKTPSEPNVGLSLILGANVLSPLDVGKNETVLIMFNTASTRGTKTLNLNVKFELTEEMKTSDAYKKVVDERKSDKLATFHIMIRDAETGLPVLADLNIKDKKRSNLYYGSDFFFNTENYSKLTIKCDAAGYFFQDQEVTVQADSEKELIIAMKPVSQGKILKIDKIEFVRGTADLFPGSESILNRIRDFLVLNADLKIEIQGHVNNEGNDNVSTRKLSERRAKKIMRYFIQSGVNRDRMVAKGYGNKIPIYPIPKTEREDQANRRVEIKIL